MNKKVQYHLLAIFLMILWGLSYLSIKVVVSEIDPGVSALYRFLLATFILYFYHKFKVGKVNILKKDKINLAFAGLIGVSLYFYFENYAVNFTSAANVAIILSSIPLFTFTIRGLFYKEKFSPIKIFGAILSCIGLIIIVASKDRVSLFSKGTVGDLMTIGAALSWVIYGLITSKLEGNYSSLTITTYQSIWGTIFLIPSIFIGGIHPISMLASVNLLFLSVGCTCFGYIAYVVCLKNLGDTVINTYVNLQPIVSIVSAYFLLGEAITLYQIIGSSIIIFGIFFVSLPNRKKTLEPCEN